MKSHTRKALFGTLLAVLVISAPFAAAARPFGSGSYGGPGWAAGCDGWGPGIAPEKQAAFEARRQEHIDKTHPIREQLWAKQTTLDALSGNPKTDPNDIVNLVNEIAALRNQLYQERKAFADGVRQEIGIDMPRGAGGGPGGGYGYGHQGRRGFGPGGRGDHGWRGGHGGYGRGCAW